MGCLFTEELNRSDCVAGSMAWGIFAKRRVWRSGEEWRYSTSERTRRRFSLFVLVLVLCVFALWVLKQTGVEGAGRVLLFGGFQRGFGRNLEKI